MKMFNSIRTQTILCLSLWAALAGESRGQVFTIQVGAPPAPPMPGTALVNHGDLWHYHKGTNAPQANWQAIPDSALDATWAMGNGGFGYADNTTEVALVQTPLLDMKSVDLGGTPANYSTVYIRRSFETTGLIDPSQHLLLTVNFDDGYVAYLDGVEVARGNAGGSVGIEPGVGALAPVSHESFHDNAGGPIVTNDLGLASARLAPGTHTLAIMGLNAQTNSTDFILIADLAIGASASTNVVTVINGPLLSIVHSNSVIFTGTNTLPGSAHVRVDGADAAFDPGTGFWTKTVALPAGFNRFVIEAVDASGVPLFSTNQLVVSELSSTFLGGPLAASATWSPSMGVIHLTNIVTVGSGITLNVSPGTVVLADFGAHLKALAGGTINVNGAAGNIAVFGPSDGASSWGQVNAEGTGSFLTMRHAETIGAGVQASFGATLLLEDSYFHNYKNPLAANFSTPICGGTNAVSLTARRCHYSVYHETLWRFSPTTVEDCLFENADNPSSDALDFDGAVAGSVIRRCTFRHGPQSNTDAVDLGSGTQSMLVENCLMYDFPNDKGVSIGETTYAIEIRNCLMYGNDSGVAVKDLCTAIIHDCTFVDNDYGFRIYNKASPASPTGGGLITNSYNNIIANSRIAALQILNNGVLIADHSDYFGTNWPGTGNFDADPLFVNAALRDFRLLPNSPCIGTGRNGATLGAKFPVGSPLAPSHPTISSIVTAGGVVKVGFWVDSEKNYTLQGKADVASGTWTRVADVYHQMLPRFVEVTNSLASGHRFYRLVTPVQP